MDIHADAMLFFGFPVGGEREPPEWLPPSDDEDPFEEFLHSIYGEDGYEAYRERVKTCPADMVVYCSHHYPLYLLGVRGTQVVAERGDAVAISTPDVPAEKIAAFRTWCAEQGIKWQEPQWHMACILSL